MADASALPADLALTAPSASFLEENVDGSEVR
jgi:hypothetical protein